MLFGAVRDASLRASSRASDCAATCASGTRTPLPNWRFGVDRMGSRCAGRTNRPRGPFPDSDAGWGAICCSGVGTIPPSRRGPATYGSASGSAGSTSSRSRVRIYANGPLITVSVTQHPHRIVTAETAIPTGALAVMYRFEQ